MKTPFETKQTNALLVIALHFFATAFIFTSIAYIDALFLTTYPASWLAYFYFTQATLLISVTALLNRFIAGRPKQFFITVPLLGAMLLVLYRLIPNTQLAYVPFVYCAFLMLINQLVGVVAWNASALALDIREFKRLGKWITGSGTLGGISFALSIPLMVALGGAAMLGNVLFVQLAGMLVIMAYLKVGESTKKSDKPSLTMPFTYPVYKLLFVYVVILLISNTLIDYSLKVELASNFQRDGISNYMGIYLAVTNIIMLFAQVFLSERLMMRFGMICLFIFLPFAHMLSGIAVLAYPGLATVTLLAGTHRLIYYVFNNLGREVVLNVLPKQIRVSGKMIIKGAGVFLGTTLAASVVWLAAQFAGVRLVAAIVIALSFFLIYYIRHILVEYKTILEEAVALKRFYSDPDQYPIEQKNVLQNVVTLSLEEDNIEQILFGFSVLPKASFKALPEVVSILVSHESSEVRIEAIKAIHHAGSEAHLPCLQNQYRKETNQEVGWYLLNAIYHFDVILACELARARLEGERGLAMAAAIRILLEAGSLKEVIQSLQRLQTMLQSEHRIEREGVARVLGIVKVGCLDSELNLLIDDKSELVAMSAITAAAEQENHRVIPAIVARLGYGNTSLLAANVLVEFGKTTITSLVPVIFESNKIATRIAAIRVLSKIDAKQAEQQLIAACDLTNALVLNKVAKYSAYRAKSLAVSDVFLKHAQAMVQRERDLIYFLKQIENINYPDFVTKEIISRRHLAAHRFVYWLAICSNPHAVLEIYSSLFLPMQTKEMQTIRAKALELLETYVRHADHVKYIADVFEATPFEIDEEKVNEQKDILDPWLRQFIESPPKAEIGKAMNTIQKVMVLRSVGLFHELAGESLVSIAEETSVREMAKGEVIFAEGDMPDGMYMIVSGSVDIVKDAKTLVTLHKNDFFGELSLIDNQPRTAGATAASDGLLLYLDQAMFDRITEDLPEVLKAVTHMIIQYLRSTYQKEKAVAAENAEED